MKHQEIILSFFQVGALTDCEDIINSVNGFEFGPVLELMKSAIPDNVASKRKGKKKCGCGNIKGLSN